MARKNNKKGQGRRGTLNPIAVSAPVAAARTSVRNPMRIRSGKNGDGRITVTHTEWVEKVEVGNVLFAPSIDKFINPGLPGSFPWLSNIANNYETYCFESMRFRYVPRCPTSTAGTVMMHMDYDCLDDVPTSESRLMNSHRAVSGPSWAALELVCDVADLKKWPQRYTRKGEHVVPDQKTYDVGRFSLCTEGVGLQSLGSLFIDYTVTLMTPQLRDQLTDDCRLITLPQDVGLTPNNPLGLPVRQELSGGLPISVGDGANLIIKDIGEYLINGYWSGANITTLPGVTIPLGQGAVNVLTSHIRADGGTAFKEFKVKTLTPDTPLTFGAMTANALTGGWLRANPYAFSL